MGKFLFVVPPFFGHISPTLSVGAALLSRGHQVMWAGLQGIAASRVPAGGTFVVLDSNREELDRILRRQDDGPSVGGAEVLKLALEETYIPFCRMMMQELPVLVERFGPDVIVSDCISFAGAFCGYRMGIPVVTTTPVPPDVMGSAMDMPRIREWQERLIFDLQREFGIFDEGAVIHSLQMNIVFTSRLFAGVGVVKRFDDATDIAGMEEDTGVLRFVGPVRGRPEEVAFNWERLERANGKKIFVSLGTLLVDIRSAYFRKIVDAFGSLPVTVVAATDPSTLESWPDNFIVQSFVPQACVMEKMDAVICHGGFNTVNDAIMHELPILITPIAYDHFHTASLIERAGCGISIRYKRMRGEDVRLAMGRLLEEEGFRVNASRIRESFERSGGAAKAVELLEEVVGASGGTDAAAPDGGAAGGLVADGQADGLAGVSGLAGGQNILQ